jgi:sec-independent protein translocase protein TatB
MFGMGFMEIMLILIVAVIALGPEKLPTAAVDIAKFLKKMRSSVDDAKSTIDSELTKTGLKDEASNFKDSIGIDRLANLNLDNLIDEDDDFNDSNKKDKKIKQEDKSVKASYSTVEHTEDKKKEV